VLPLHGPNLFPDAEVPALRPAVLHYMDVLADLASKLLKGLAVGLLGPQHVDYFHQRFSDDPTRLFRIFRYPV
jgi:isopenicillin N synthase-like dioxygenase